MAVITREQDERGKGLGKGGWRRARVDSSRALAAATGVLQIYHVGPQEFLEHSSPLLAGF